MFENYIMFLHQFPSKEAVRSFLPDRGSVVDHPLDCIKALPLVWDVEGFEDVREGGVVTTDPTDGSFQVKEALLLQDEERKKEKEKKMRTNTPIIG